MLFDKSHDLINSSKKRCFNNIIINDGGCRFEAAYPYIKVRITEKKVCGQGYFFITDKLKLDKIGQQIIPECNSATVVHAIKKLFDQLLIKFIERDLDRVGIKGNRQGLLLQVNNFFQS